MKLWTPIVTLLAVVVTAGVVLAEPCMSPYVKRLAGPEKYLYVYAVDGDAKDNDFMAVVDLSPASPTYGPVLNTMEPRSAGDEPHPQGLPDPRTKTLAR